MCKLSKAQLSNKISELTFAAIDLNLFLDTHPNNQQALIDYNKITDELKSLTSIYEDNFGPLTSFGGAKSQYPWSWINEPWPWESGE